MFVIFQVIFILIFCPFYPLYTDKIDTKTTLFSQLDPRSIAEQLAFYSIYNDTTLGKQAHTRAMHLMGLPEDEPCIASLDVAPFLTLRQKNELSITIFSPTALCLIERAATKLHNRTLKGFTLNKIEEILQLPDEEIDVGEALLYLQLQDETERRKTRALLDVMALQLLAMIPNNATEDQKINAINKLLFYDMGFRFPPHSTYEKEIDQFTLLPSVIERKRGVCLGVTLIYISLAQRIGLDLEIVTPPGHIYVRTPHRNIETTLRGVHLPTHTYYSLAMKQLPVRSKREVVGLSFMNQASLLLSSGKYKEAYDLYKQAAVYIQNDSLLEGLLGITLFFMDDEGAAKKQLLRAKKLPSCEMNAHTLCEDILEKRITKKGLAPLFQPTNNSRISIENKKQLLEETVKEHPQFRTGLLQLAICHLQLHEPKEAIAILEKRSQLDNTDITTEYLLSTLYVQRNHIPNACTHFLQAKRLAIQQKNSQEVLDYVYPETLVDLEHELFYLAGSLQNRENSI